MPDLNTTPAYQLTATEKAEIVTQLSQSIVNNNTPINISDTAKPQDTSTLTKVTDLTGVTSIPAVKNDTDIVAVPLNLLTTNKPVEVAGQDAIDVLVAQGKIVDTQIYFTPVEDE